MATYPTYTNEKTKKKQALASQIASRAAFSYDPETDASYQAYKNQYTRQGKQAMQDTQGQAAALTGGYGSTYAENAGAKAYESYLEKLNDVLPTLEKQAYQRYKDEGDALQSQYDLLSEEESQEYQRYLDAYNQWKDEMEREQEAEQTAYDRQQDALNRADKQLSLKNNNYASLYKLITEYGYSPSDEELAASGMSRAQAEALLKGFISANTVSENTVKSGTSKVAEILKPLSNGKTRRK